MQRAIIVKLDLHPDFDPEVAADEIKELMEDQGYVVLSSTPWSDNTLNNLAPEMGELKGEPHVPGTPSL